MRKVVLRSGSGVLVGLAMSVLIFLFLRFKFESGVIDFTAIAAPILFALCFGLTGVYEKHEIERNYRWEIVTSAYALLCVVLAEVFLWVFGMMNNVLLSIIHFCLVYFTVSYLTRALRKQGRSTAFVYVVVLLCAFVVALYSTLFLVSIPFILVVIFGMGIYSFCVG